MLTVQPNLHIIDALVQHGFTAIKRGETEEIIVGRIEIDDSSAGVFYSAEKSFVVMALFTKPSARKKGAATQVLKTICNAADHVGVPITLGAKPHGNSQNYNSLVTWYEKRGFTVVEDWDRKDREEPVKMKRLPHTK